MAFDRKRRRSKRAARQLGGQIILGGSPSSGNLKQKRSDSAFHRNIPWLLPLFFSAMVRGQPIRAMQAAPIVPEAQYEELALTEPDQQPTTPIVPEGATSYPAKQHDQSQITQGEQTKRMFWVVPNFAAVSSGAQLPPLSTKQKFVLASHDSFDYSSFVWTGILAAQALALNSDPELGHGMAGYARYYWRAFADGMSGTFFTEAIVPAIRHEDPRYYTLGKGGFLRRLTYALSRTVITKTDTGGTSFNFSEVGGNALEAGLSNAYYPPQERGLKQTARGWATQMESAALNNIAKEFWPDIRTRVFRRK